MKKLLVLAALLAATPALGQSPQTPEAILKASPKADWRAIDPANTLYMDLPSGRVVIELAPDFAPNHVANIKMLVRQGYFDGLVVLRVQDGFVAQWGDPNEDEDGREKPRSFGKAAKSLKAEFIRADLKGVRFTPWPDRDTWADAVGFVNDMPAAMDPKTGQAWLTHCPGTVAVARDTSADSGSGAALYSVITQQARRLDKNLTVVGRIVEGYPLLAKLKPGPGSMGMYMPADLVPITRVRVASDLPTGERKALEELRTDSATFKAVADLKRFQKNDFYQVPVGAVQLCDAPLTVRPAAP